MQNTNKKTNILHSNKITLRTDFNDPRTNLNNIKMTDLAYIKEKTGVTSDYDVSKLYYIILKSFLYTSIIIFM